MAHYYPYLCPDCHLRFLCRRSEPAKKPVSRPSGVEREIKATRRAMKATRKRRELALYGVGLLLFLTILYFITLDRSSTVSRVAPAAGIVASVIS